MKKPEQMTPVEAVEFARSEITVIVAIIKGMTAADISGNSPIDACGVEWLVDKMDAITNDLEAAERELRYGKPAEKPADPKPSKLVHKP